MASSQPWPFDDNRPSGSSPAPKPGRPAGHPRPPRPRPQPATGWHQRRPAGGDGAGAGQAGPAWWLRAHATWRRARAAEWATWTRALPTSGWPPPSASAPPASPRQPVGAPAEPCSRRAGGRGGLLRLPSFRPSPEAVAWRRGAAGEVRSARLPRAAGAARVGGPARSAVPRSQANIDHLVIGPGGVFMIDSKQYQRPPPTRLLRAAVAWPLPRPTLRAVSFEADQAAQVLPDPRRGRGADRRYHRAQVPWAKVVTDGVPVVSAGRLPSMLRQLPVVLEPERVAWLADQALLRFRPAA